MMILFTLLILWIQDPTLITQIDGEVSEIEHQIVNQQISGQVVTIENVADYDISATLIDVKPFILSHFKISENQSKLSIQIMDDTQDIILDIYRIGDQHFVRKSIKEYESNRSESGFDSTKFETSVSRYYFNSQKLIRWVNPQNRVIEAPAILLQTQELLLVNDMQKFEKLTQ